MKILIVSATIFEVAPLQAQLEQHFASTQPFQYHKGSLSVYLLVTGVGMTATAFALGKLLGEEGFFQLAINAGIAGAYNRDLQMGEVVQVVSERYGDLGVEEANGDFTDVFELGLLDGKAFPYQNDRLELPKSKFDFFRKVHGLTVNKVHGSSTSIDAITQKYNADVETMEGAAFAYACLQSDLPCVELRAISNYVEPRNRNNWNLPLAIEQLNKALWELLNHF